MKQNHDPIERILEFIYEMDAYVNQESSRLKQPFRPIPVDPLTRL